MTDNAFYGWFDEAGQTTPSYDPPHDSPCPYCGKPINGNDVRTHSLMMVGPVYAKRSYFYRSHRTCDEDSKGMLWEGATMDDFLFRMIEKNGD